MHSLMIGCLQVIPVSRNCLNKQKNTAILTMLKAKLKTPILYVTARNCKFLKCTFVCIGFGLAYMKKVFKKISRHTLPEAKVIKTVSLMS